MTSSIPLTDIMIRLRLWSPLASCEVSSVANMLSEKRSELDETESRIQSLEQELLQLKNRRKRLLEDLKACQGLLAPIRSLPLELLLEIFALVCTGTEIRYIEDEEVVGDAASDGGDDEYEYETYSLTTVKVPSVILAQVCSTWNGVVNHSAFLWSKISLEISLAHRPVTLSDMFLHHILRVEKAIAHVFARSGNEALHISLAYETDDMEEVSPKISSILTHFLDQSYRWKTAELDIHQVEDLFLTRLCKPMPALEKLTFMAEESVRPADPFFGQAPLLRTVTFHSTYAILQSQPVWADLHTLIIEVDRGAFPSISHVKAILSQCKSLRTLSWNARVDGSGNSERAVILPVTSFAGGARIDALLPHVQLPNLKALHFHLIAPDPSHENVLSSEQEVYRNVITTLEVKTWQPLFLSWNVRSVQAMFAQLGSFPQLQTLVLEHSAKEGPACSLDGISNRFPKLGTLSYTIRGGIVDSVFNDVISLLKAFQQTTDSDESFQRRSSVLKTVELNFPNAVLDNETLSTFREMQEIGLHLTVRGARGKIWLANVLRIRH